MKNITKKDRLEFDKELARWFREDLKATELQGQYDFEKHKFKVEIGINSIIFHFSHEEKTLIWSVYGVWQIPNELSGNPYSGKDNIYHIGNLQNGLNICKRIILQKINLLRRAEN